MAAPEKTMPARTSRPSFGVDRRRLKNGIAIVCGSILVVGVLIGTIAFLWLGTAGTRVVASDAVITFSPNPVEFGGQATGTTSGVRTVVVGNQDRTLAVAIRSVEISGADTSDFTLATNICKAVTIPAGQSCSIDIRFTPKATGMRQAVLLVDRGDVSRSLTLMLRGQGVSQPLSVRQPRLDFGQIAVNATSVTRTIPATNTSDQPVVMEGVALTGDGAQDFSMKAAPGCAGTTLRPGDSCAVSVTFTPTDYGDRTASLAYSYQGAGSPLSVGLSGVGAALSLKVTPASLDFGRQQVGTVSGATLATISTPAGTVVTIGSVTVTGLDAVAFKITSDNCTSKTLTPRDSCTVAIQFGPGAVGSKTSSLAIVRANEVTVVSAVQLNGFGFVPG